MTSGAPALDAGLDFAALTKTQHEILPSIILMVFPHRRPGEERRYSGWRESNSAFFFTRRAQDATARSNGTAGDHSVGRFTIAESHPRKRGFRPGGRRRRRAARWRKA